MNGTRCAALIASPLAFRAQARSLSLSLSALVSLSLSLSLSLSALFFSSSFLPKYLSSNLFKEISFISILLLLLSDVAGLSSLLFFFFFFRVAFRSRRNRAISTRISTLSSSSSFSSSFFFSLHVSLLRGLVSREPADTIFFVSCRYSIFRRSRIIPGWSGLRYRSPPLIKDFVVSVWLRKRYYLHFIDQSAARLAAGLTPNRKT